MEKSWKFVSEKGYKPWHYMLFFIDFFSKKKKIFSRAELFDCGVSNDMSKVTHLLVCIVLTHVFVLLVQFALKALILSDTGVNFLLEDYRNINLLEYFCFLEINVCIAFIPLFVDFVCYLTFWPDPIQIYRSSRQLTISCVLYAAME